MNHCYKIGSSFIRYDNSKEKEIALRDEHDRVDISQAPFEQIIKAWKEGRFTCRNARGTAPGWRLYDEGVIIECFEEDNLRFVWFPEDDWEAIIQAYNKFTQPLSQVDPYGLILPNDDFMWEGLISLSCPSSTMKVLCVAPRDFTKLTIDDWMFEQRNEVVAGCHNHKSSFMRPAKEFFASLDYWQKETQE